MEISAWIAQWAARTPDKVAIRFETQALTYRDVEQRVAALAAFLVASGVGPGDRVAYLGPSCPEVLEALFACARIGAVLVPLNSRMPASELTVFVRQCEPRLLLAETRFLEVAQVCASEVVVFTAGEGVRRQGALPCGPGPADGSEAVLILYTSGTTGKPKGAVLTNDAINANAISAVTAFQLSAADHVLTVTPMFHIAGLNLLTAPALLMGGTVTIHRNFHAAEVLAELGAGSITLLLCPPPLTRELGSHPNWDVTQLTELRCVMTGGTTVTPPAVQPWRDRGVPVVQGYGMTETGTNVTLEPLGDASPRALTAGLPTLGSTVRVLGPDGREVPPGEPGEIAVRTPSLMREYWNNPEATSTAFVHGWLRTGDLGWLDSDGRLHVVDRLKEVIIVGTSNVYPADLEAVLAESPDIAAAAVVGRPDPALGEAPVAFVVPAPGKTLTRQAVLAMFDGKVADYKKPRDVIFLDALPHTSVGKPHKLALRELATSGASRA